MFYNTHFHIFHGILDVAKRFLPFPMMELLKGNESSAWVAGILHNINPFSDNDKYDKTVTFVKTGRLPNQRAIFENGFKEYPKDTKLCVLTMDMAYMGAGKVPRPYEEQLVELYNLTKIYSDNIMPFIHIDCRRKNHFDLFKQAIEEWGFKGLKSYPPLGTFPYNQEYYKEYEYCQKYNLPVIAHCTAGNPVHFMGRHKELKELLKGCKLDIDWNQSDKDLCAYFTNPLGWGYVMDDFSDIKIDLAHYGRGTAWDLLIQNMMDKYKNLYADSSYSMSDKSLWSKTKLSLITNPVLRERLMFGSDYYMVSRECSEQQFDIDFRVFLGEELFQQIAVINPMKFLNLK